MSDTENAKCTQPQGVQPGQRCQRLDWLRSPAILLILIGVIGILADKSDYLNDALSFLALPPLVHSIVITVLACLLLIISIVCKDTRKPDLEPFRENWRSM